MAAPQAAGRARRVSFLALVVAFGVMHLFLSPMQFALLGWFLDTGIVSHRVHEVSFGLAFVVSFVGLIGLVRRPEDKPAAMWQVALPVWVLVGSFLSVDRILDPVVFTFLVVPAGLLALHPRPAQVVRPPLAPHAVQLALAAVLAVPMLWFAATEFRTGLEAAAVAPPVYEQLPPTASETQVEEALRRAVSSERDVVAALHYGHWSAMGGFAIGIVAVSAVAALGIPGWRRAAWSAAVAVAVFGAVSLSAPRDASAASPMFAIGAIVWALAFGAAAWVRARPLVDEGRFAASSPSEAATG